MADIYIKKKNEAFITLQCENQGIYYELDDRYTFFVEGYNHMPKFKNGIWDGKIRLFNVRSRQIYSGLLGNILSYAKSCGYSVSLDVALKSDFEDIVYALNTLKLPEHIVPHDYQNIAVNKILNNKRNLILSPTGSGKSLIIYGATRFLLAKKKKVLIVVPTVSLVEQLCKDFLEYGWVDVDKHVHMIYSGKEKRNIDDVVLTTWQSVYKMPQSWFKDFDAVFIDEAHLATAVSLKAIMEKAINANYRIGLTGTLKDAKVNKLVLSGLFGSTYSTTKTSELMKVGVLSKLSIEAILLKHKPEDCKIVSKMKYLAEINTIVEDQRRNAFIANIALDRKYNTLILFNFVDKHGKKLYDMIVDKNKDKKIFFIHGGVKVEEREYVRAYTEKHDNVIIVASFGTFATGTNIKNLNTIMFAHPYKSKIKNLQSIGRVLRKAPNGEPSVLFDIADDYRHGKKQNTTYRHFMERLEIYEQESFDYKLRVLDI